MIFITPNLLDSFKTWSSDTINNLASNFKFGGSEFLEACRTNNCEKADKLISDNLNQLMKTEDVRSAMIILAEKFPELDIDLSDTARCKKMILELDKHTDEMLKIAKERGIL